MFTILVCVGCDQITKVMAREHLPRKHALSFAGEVIGISFPTVFV